MRVLSEDEVARIPIPVSEWKRIYISLNVGQVQDRVLQLPTGQRLHAHVFPDGTVKVHVDEYDPERSFLHAFLHVSSETPYGTLLKVAGMVLFLSSLANNRR